MAIEFVEAVPERSPKTPYEPINWAPIVQALRDKPGHWAIVDRAAALKENPFRVRISLAAKRHGLQQCVRTVDGVLTAYMRAPEQS